MNATPIGRFLAKEVNSFNRNRAYFLQSIEDWWDYEGGKQLVGGVVIGVFEIAIAVVGIAAAVLTLISAPITIPAAIIFGASDICKERVRRKKR